jgi:predicted MFS family arabinose efflux permease
MNDSPDSTSVGTAAKLRHSPAFRAYLRATGFTGIAMSMQQLLVSWLLVGILQLPGNEVGVAQAMIGLPGILLMLWGGASADRNDPRRVLVRVYTVAPVVPLALAVAIGLNGLTLWTVTIWGLGMSIVMTYSAPSLAAILNRVTGHALQRGVTASTAVAFGVQMLGLAIAGQLERIGLLPVLAVQASCLAIGALAIRRIAPSPPVAPSAARSAVRDVIEGLAATLRHRVIASIVALNFSSSVFNAGAFLTVLPFVVERVYEGNAAVLATMMIVFFGGAAAANLMMLRFMPIMRPGRIFLVMQLSRALVLCLIWIEPPFWLLVVALVLWGLNMGVTSTLARTIVQESAEAEFRGRILSVFNIALMGSAPIGAIVLGRMIEAWGTLNALIPSIAVSLAIFVIGILGTGIWQYRSPMPMSTPDSEPHSTPQPTPSPTPKTSAT